MEQEAREILKTELGQPARAPKNLADAIREIFAPFGGVELRIPPREPIPESKIK